MNNKSKIKVKIEIEHENEYMEFYAEPEERIRLKSLLIKDVIDKFNDSEYDVNVKSIKFVKEK